MVASRIKQSAFGKNQAISNNLEGWHRLLKLGLGFSLNKLLESTLLPLVIPVLLWVLGVEDIFLLKTAFPWLIVVPVIIAARYGTWFGLLSLFVFAIASLSYTFLYQNDVFNRVFNILAGNLLIVIFVGEMLHYWKHKYNVTEQQILACDQDNEKISQELQLLHVAYSQLEENLVTTTRSVSNSLRLLEVSLQPALDKKLQTKLAITKLHEILDEYQWLEESVFFYVNDEGVINPVPLASKARFLKDLHKDILVSKAIESKRAVISKENKKFLIDKDNSQLQAVIPLIDSRQHLWGVMAIVRMTPTIFKQQNLNLLSLLCSYVANLLSASERSITSAESLYNETSTAINIVLNSVKSVFFIRIHIPFNADHDRHKAFFVNKIKGISRIWQLQKKEEMVLVVLVPLFKRSTASIWQDQLEKSFVKQFSKYPRKANIKIFIKQFQKNVSRNNHKIDF